MAKIQTYPESRREGGQKDQGPFEFEEIWAQAVGSNSVKIPEPSKPEKISAENIIKPVQKVIKLYKKWWFEYFSCSKYGEIGDSWVSKVQQNDQSIGGESPNQKSELSF